MSSLVVLDAPVSEIDPITLYRLLALRVDIFVVEQQCAYRELDGRDLEPGARLVWAHREAQPGQPIATLRLLRDGDTRARIGRVATAAGARSGGVASQLIAHALALCGPTPVVLDAQVQLADWYARFGFIRCGAEFDEDGITHVPMRRP